MATMQKPPERRTGKLSTTARSGYCKYCAPLRELLVRMKGEQTLLRAQAMPLRHANVLCRGAAHAQYLMPAHLRKGKGGRQPATDPRHDPRVDSKKARRILANRLSAARSKMRQKTAVNVRLLQVI